MISCLAEGKEWDEQQALEKFDKNSKVRFHNTQSRNTVPSYQNQEEYTNDSTHSERENKQDSEISYQQFQNSALDESGKYNGFGFTREPSHITKSQSQDFFDNTLSTMASGWSIFSSTATKIAAKATENAVKFGEIATQKVRDGSLMDDLSVQVSNLTSKVSEYSRRGWQNIPGSNMANMPRSQSEYCSSAIRSRDEFGQGEQAVSQANVVTKNLQPQPETQRNKISDLEEEAWNSLNE